MSYPITILIMGKMLFNYVKNRDLKSTGYFDCDESDTLVIIWKVSLDLNVGLTEILEGICLGRLIAGLETISFWTLIKLPC